MSYSKKKCYIYFCLLCIIIFNYNCAFASQKEEFLSDIRIDNSYIRVPYQDSPNAVGYMSIVNNTQHDIYLLNIVSPDLCNDILIHHVQPNNDKNIHEIIPLTEILIPSYSTVHFTSGTLYFMILNLKKKIIKGDSYPINLFFNNKMITTHFKVQ